MIKQKVIRALFDEVGLNKREARDLADIYFKETSLPIEYAWKEIKDQQDRFPQLIGKDLVLAAAVAIRIASSDKRYNPRSFGEACLLERHADVERFLKSRDGDLEESDLYWAYSCGDEQVISMCEARCRDVDAKTAAMQRAVEIAACHGREDLIDYLLDRGVLLTKDLVEQLLDSSQYVAGITYGLRLARQEPSLADEIFHMIMDSGPGMESIDRIHELAELCTSKDIIQTECAYMSENMGSNIWAYTYREFCAFTKLGWQYGDLNPFQAALMSGDVEGARKLLVEGRDVEIDYRDYVENDPPGRYESNGDGFFEFSYREQCMGAWACAFAGRHHDIIEMLLGEGVPLNLPFDLNTDSLQTSPLGLAIESNCGIEVVKYLLKAGADPTSAQIFIEETPLSKAIQWEHIEIVDLLLRHGADPLSVLYAATGSIKDMLLKQLEVQIKSGRSVSSIVSEITHDDLLKMVLPQVAEYLVSCLPERHAVNYLGKNLGVSVPALALSENPAAHRFLGSLLRRSAESIAQIEAEFPANVVAVLNQVRSKTGKVASENSLPEYLMVPSWDKCNRKMEITNIPDLLSYEFTVSPDDKKYLEAKERLSVVRARVSDHPEEQRWSDALLQTLLPQALNTTIKWQDGSNIALDDIPAEFLSSNSLADIVMKAGDGLAQEFLCEYLLRFERQPGLSSVSARVARWGDSFFGRIDKKKMYLLDQEMRLGRDRNNSTWKQTTSRGRLGWHEDWYDDYRCRRAYAEQYPVKFCDFRSVKLLPVERFDELASAPEVAAIGLLPIAMDQPGRRRYLAWNGLAWLCDNGHEATVKEVASRYGQEAKALLDKILKLDRALELLPWPPGLPEWYRDVLPPELVAGGRLPPAASENLARMLAVGTIDKPYPLIAAVREICTLDSLEDYALDLCDQWEANDCYHAQSWVINALACFGHDAAVSSLVEMVKRWGKAKGRSQRKTSLGRIQLALQALSYIGSPPALLQLGMLAHRGSFERLRSQAKKIFAEAAARKGFNEEDLADQLVPDLGLSSDGQLELDYGTRRFRVSFNEKLEPQLEDEAGEPVSALPRQRRDDAPDKAKAAIARYKKLRKDVAAWSGVLIKRLEQAMLNGRRWPVPMFLEHFSHHPLVQHLVRRQVWAIYKGDTLSETFRLAEDASFADQDDREITLPDNATIGLPHPLDMEKSVIAAWQQIFADYEILPAISQLGREVYVPDDEEKAANVSKKLKGISVRPKVLYGALTGRGWRSDDDIEQYGDLIVSGFRRSLRGSQVELKLDHDDGHYGYLDRDDEPLVVEQLESKVPIGEIPVVLYSEVMRDLLAFRH